MDQEIDLINKNTRNERIINFFKKNYKIFILSISLIIIIILLFFGLEHLNKKKISNYQIRTIILFLVTNLKIKILLLRNLKILSNKKTKHTLRCHYFF